MRNKIVKNNWTEYEDYVELRIDNPTHGIFYLKIDLEDYEKIRQAGRELIYLEEDRNILDWTEIN